MSVSEREKGLGWSSAVPSSVRPSCCLSLPTSPGPPQYLAAKLMGTKRPQISSCKHRGGATKNKDQDFEFSMTLMQGWGCHTYLAQFPSMPFGEQEAAIWA